MPKIRFTNSDSDKPFVVWLEPWARDYWLRPGDAVTIEYDESDFVEQANLGAEFDVVWHDRGVTVWPASSHEAAVRDQSGTDLEYGHQRPAEG
ncbi:hypothetical protein OG203_05640 [Nocardia sp. NBC_01499]|uniref:hypothetical protein n=1 Tax=Nocardia sp. NBC_01499 TaxID=2903597 RepID=UPI0038669439